MSLRRIHAPAGLELVPDVKPPAPTVTVAMLREDKEVFDVAQAWLSACTGRRLTQWEVLAILLVDAFENPRSRLRGMPSEAARAPAVLK